LTTHVSFFAEGQEEQQDGLFQCTANRSSLNPTFAITLQPYQSQTFYMKSSSKITTLIIKLNLWEMQAFYEQEITKQVILALFFGAMLITILYNLTVFFATKELSYLYYILFFASVTFHHILYTGVGTLYLFSPQTMVQMSTYFSLIVAMPAIFLALFTQSILQLKQYPKLNILLYSLLFLYPVVILLIQSMGAYRYRNLFFTVILLYLFFVTFYAFIKGNKQARFIIFGLLLFVSSGVSMYLSSTGVYNVFEQYPYLTELCFALETVVFSFALTSKINMLNHEQHLSQRRAFLLRELNHRFKNSMQIIVSFLMMQKSTVDDQHTQEILNSLENRIIATTHLYSLLQMENNTLVVDTKRYFALITNNLQESFDQHNVEIEIECDINLDSEYVVYCGLIINEAVTNALKYAFETTDEARIDISLTEQANQYALTIRDNGKGFQGTHEDQNLGLYIIKTLAIFQLEGELNINKDHGVEIIVVWEKKKKEKNDH
ncbi:MAG TPA: hypothetical protein ENK86_00120, partial [Campylobacterales bacterium]|nr:hypothetical protein [Campylobacterales bacterium]